MVVNTRMSSALTAGCSPVASVKADVACPSFQRNVARRTAGLVAFSVISSHAWATVAA